MKQDAVEARGHVTIRWHFAAMGAMGGGLVGGIFTNAFVPLTVCTAVNSFLLGCALDWWSARAVPGPWLSPRGIARLVAAALAVVVAGVINCLMVIIVVDPGLLDEVGMLAIGFGGGFALPFVPPLLAVWVAAQRVRLSRYGSFAWAWRRRAVARVASMVSVFMWLTAWWYVPQVKYQPVLLPLGGVAFALGLGLWVWDVAAFMKARTAFAAWRRAQPWSPNKLDELVATDFGVGEGYRRVTAVAPQSYRDQACTVAVYQGDGDRAMRGLRRGLLLGTGSVAVLLCLAALLLAPEIRWPLWDPFARISAATQALQPRCGRPTVRPVADGLPYQLCLAR